MYLKSCCRSTWNVNMGFSTVCTFVGYAINRVGKICMHCILCERRYLKTWGLYFNVILIYRIQRQKPMHAWLEAGHIVNETEKFFKCSYKIYLYVDFFSSVTSVALFCKKKVKDATSAVAWQTFGISLTCVHNSVY